MKSPSKLTFLGSALACVAVMPSAYAGGIQLYEIGTPDLSLASAGYAARAQDASTVFRNPAGMSYLQGAQFQAGAQLLYGSVSFTKDASQTGPLLRDANDGGNAIGALPGAGLFFVQPLSQKFAVGLGTFSYFGLMEKYNDDWAGRYYIQEGSLLGMSLMPAVSYKPADWLSIGAGLNAMYGYFENKVALRTGGAGDGQMTLKDETWGFGANAGVMVEPRKGTRFGLTYLSPVSLDFKDTPSFSNLGPLGGALFTSPSQLDLGMTVPQSVMFSVYQQLNSKWALLANVGWQNWHQFGKVAVGTEAGSGDPADSSPQTFNLNYQDTWHGAIGAQFRASEKWLLSGGVAYDTSAVNDADRTLSLPMGEAYRFGVGAQWQVSKAVNLGAGYEFMWAGDMPVTQDSPLRGRIAGSYNDSWFSFFNLNLTWKF